MAAIILSCLCLWDVAKGAATHVSRLLTPAATKVVHRGYFSDDCGPYAYRPAYAYRGYTYWYPTYGNWAYPGDYSNWW